MGERKPQNIPPEGDRKAKRPHEGYSWAEITEKTKPSKLEIKYMTELSETYDEEEE